jgi:hypothetical protein
LDKTVLDWLLASPAWLRYAVESQLLGFRPDITPVLADPAVYNVVARLKSSATGIPAIRSGRVHYTEPGKAYWDLFLLADIGLSLGDVGLTEEAESVFSYQSSDGSFTMPPNVQDNYFCMSAILISSLAKMGYHDDPRIEKYIHLVMSSQNYDGGWHCYGYGSDNIGIGACPMDNLNILMLLGQYDKYRHSPSLMGACSLLLQHWQIRDNMHGFGIGRRFKSLQYPAVKYGILRVLDILSLFPAAVSRPGFRDMLDFVHGKASDGRYFAESGHPAYADFDFAQDTAPSRWITFLVNRIDKRVTESE